jgi:hypothetical protein
VEIITILEWFRKINFIIFRIMREGGVFWRDDGTGVNLEFHGDGRCRGIGLAEADIIDRQFLFD